MQLQKGIQLHFIKTTKFKDIGISIRFRNTLSERNAAPRSLLALMLCDRSFTYDTKEKMNAVLDRMYGATLNAQTAGYGKAQVLEIKTKIVNPSYINYEIDLLKESFIFLHEILFAPLLSEEVFQESKAILLAKIERNEDDPSQFAISEGLKFAGVNTPLAISSLGEKKRVKEITLNDIKKAYQSLLQEDLIDIIICGDVDEEITKENVLKQLVFTPRESNIASYYRVENNLHEEEHFAYKKISQSSIMMTWFTNTSVKDEAYYALRVANAMLGQYSTSLLFQEVREKNSLCYSIFSNLISYDGALGVTTGVEKANIAKSVALIKEQFKKIVDNDFSDELFNVSKEMIVNSLKASNDNMNSLFALQYQNILLQNTYTTNDVIALVESVKREQVVQALSLCELKMTYVLSQGEANEENK
ncbi:MAG: pitrilysin family protein [Longicatena sp.]